MKKELLNYYDGLSLIFKTEFDSPPLASYTDDVDPRLVLTPPDEEGLVVWKIVEQSQSHDWSKLEQRLKFTINAELKDYYSSFLFLQLSGRIDSILLYFEPIFNENKLIDLVLRQYLDGQYVFPKTQVFYLGAAIVDQNDGYSIYYDNETNKLFLFDSEEKQYSLRDCSLQEVIGRMEPII